MPPRDYAMATAGLSTPIHGWGKDIELGHHPQDIPPSFGGKPKEHSDQGFAFPIGRCLLGVMRAMLSPKRDISHPGSQFIGGISFPKFSQMAGKFPGPSKQPHLRFVTGSRAACPTQALPRLLGGGGGGRRELIYPDPV